jgi:APA family basic amino acid/polyamine antiporter
MADKPQLKREIGPLHAAALVVGSIIGISIFVQPSEVTREVPTVLGVYSVWLVSGILTLFGALVCAELASLFTRSGGVYVYLKEAFSPAVGFLWGWAMFWVMHSGIIAVIAMLTGGYLERLITGTEADMDSVSVRTIGMGIIVFWSAVNYLGVRQGSRLQTAFTIGKVFAIAIIILLAFLLGGDSTRAAAAVAPAAPAGEITLEGFLKAVAAGVFAFGGWHMVTYTAGETVDPHRAIPRALCFGVILVTICYVALNAAYLHILPLETVTQADQIAAKAADALLGSGGDRIMSALVVFSGFGTISAIILCGPRVYYAMAKDGLAFRFLGDVHPRFHTPHWAIILQAVWACFLLGIGSYREIFGHVVEIEWIFFAVMASGLFVFRRRGLARAYSVWGYPVVPLLFILCAVVVGSTKLFYSDDPLWSLSLGLLPVLAGLPVYYVWIWQGKDRNPVPDQ